MTSSEDVKPGSVMEALQWVSSYLTLCDKLITAVNRARHGQAAEESRSDEVQADLLRLGDWFEKHPAEAAAAGEYVWGNGQATEVSR